MSHPLTVASESFVARMATDPRLSEAARKRAARELARREQYADRCPKGRRCTSWSCDLEHI